MSYEVIKLAADKLTLREKMKLAQYLVQAAIKEDEERNPTTRPVAKSQLAIDRKTKISATGLSQQELVEYAQERLLKSKPGKVQSLTNFLSAMFQFQGGIDEADIEGLIKALEKKRILKVDGTKVSYT
ncbi:MAG: hypothetical protein ACW7DS_17895 [Paraglaciecola chathamensis]